MLVNCYNHRLANLKFYVVCINYIFHLIKTCIDTFYLHHPIAALCRILVLTTKKYVSAVVHEIAMTLLKVCMEIELLQSDILSNV